MTDQQHHSRILGTGSILPSRVLTNDDLEKLVDTSDSWITERTGIKERRIAEEGETLSDYGAEAARRALEQAEVDPEELDLIVCATVTPDWHLPASACFIQSRLRAKRAAAFDLAAGCSGFLYGLSLADQFIRAGSSEKVLVVGAELLSKFIDWEDRGTCVIFADGAGAAVIGRANDDSPSRILGSRMYANGDLADFICIPGGGTEFPPGQETLDKRLQFIKMKGSETFKLAVRCLTEVCKEVLRDGDMKPEDVDLFIPHQANKRIIDAVGQRLGITDSRTYVNIERTGNTSAASIPIALDEANREGRIHRGDVLLSAAFGAGLTWAANLAIW